MATIQFWSQKLFEKSNRVKISYEGVARKCHVTTRSAKNYIKRDIQSGLIVRQRNKYKHPLFKKICDGRNTYILTEEGRGVLRKKPPYQPPRPPSTSKGGSQLLLNLSKNGRPLPVAEVLNNQGYKFPSWWFEEDPPLLEKALLLLKSKIKKGYKVRNPIGWVSSVLKDQGCGYRQKIAQDVLFHLNTPGLIDSCSEPVYQLYNRLRFLKEKGLDTSVSSLLKLLRKGFAHLGDALCAMEKLLHYSIKINNVTAFLNYLTSLKDPHSAYKRNKSPKKGCIQLAQNFLTMNASTIKFVNKKILPEAPESKKTYLEFLVHKTVPDRSFIRVFQFIRGRWKEKLLKAIDPFFIKQVQELVSNP